MTSGLGLVPSGPWIGRTRTAGLADCYSTFMNELLAQRACNAWGESPAISYPALLSVLD